MKLSVSILLVLAAVVIVECSHTFMGTSVQRPLVYHHNAQYSSKVFRKRIENLYYAMPAVPSNFGRVIQGILAFDLTFSGASANVTQGGIGYNFVNLRMKSDRGAKTNFDVYIYA
ncbi:unnamed protein product [Chrysodeixis includens]|uniref:MBF2 protein n=1 Tax=Chrysodeixis includens TaxID=689277 RepID=A0A9P0BJJ1_CHRIL|nr:unnamed protein product [Chrysodeixis includens]